ncbi:MAG: SDR family oxidoreductase [Pirellulaceae bacterium]|nr:SDR family oxidoreductase [Pirellulaceae bacterium]
MNTEKNPKNDHNLQGVLVVGCGYLGRRVADQCRRAGHRVWATTRSRGRANELAASGFEPIVLDWTDRRSLAGLPQVSHVLVAVSYDRSSQIDRYQSQVGGLRNLLAVVAPTAKICYISTTGVYHQCDGSWVDENSVARPVREGGQVHLQAEQELHRNRPHAPWTVLRLAGIYGPNRVPRAADVIHGRPIQSPQDGYLNLIHVDDAVSVVLASWRQAGRRLYVVSDNQPVLRGDFYREIARQCHVQPPRFEPPSPAAPVAMRSASNKRVWNRRMKSELVPHLKYPTYREGLRDVLQQYPGQ